VRKTSSKEIDIRDGYSKSRKIFTSGWVVLSRYTNYGGNNELERLISIGQPISLVPCIEVGVKETRFADIVVYLIESNCARQSVSDAYPFKKKNPLVSTLKGHNMWFRSCHR
jgi:hypothetical protein